MPLHKREKTERSKAQGVLWISFFCNDEEKPALRWLFDIFLAEQIYIWPARTSSNSFWISSDGGAVIRETTTIHRQENRKAGSSS